MTCQKSSRHHRRKRSFPKLVSGKISGEDQRAESSYDGEEWDPPLDSDPEEATHKGNGKACQFHNHDGCRTQYSYSHTSDDRSLRDELYATLYEYSYHPEDEMRASTICLGPTSGTKLLEGSWFRRNASGGSYYARFPGRKRHGYRSDLDLYSALPSSNRG